MRRRSAVLAVLALLAIVAVLAWLALRERSVADGSDPATAATEDELARGRDAPARQRARAKTGTETSASAASDAAPTGDAAHVDGWPAADVVVRRADGAPVPGALVYVIPAGEPSPRNLDLIARRNAGPDGRLRFPVAAAGRFDVGATGDVFESVVPDVEFPARAPVEIVLPDLVPLEIRKEGDVPGDGWVTIARAAATRIAANPGRHESRYVGGSVKALGAHVLVPRGVPLRVRTTGGVVASPEVVEAPGPLTLRADPRREVEVEFVFVPDADLATRWLQFHFEFERIPGDPDSLDGGPVCLRPAPHVESRRVTLRCRPALTTVRWRCSSDPGREGGEAVIDAAAIPPGGAHRVEVPVAKADLRLFGYRIVAPPGTTPRAVRAMTSLGRLFESVEVVPGREVWFASPNGESHGDRAIAEPIAAVAFEVAPGEDPWLVAAPRNVEPDRVVELGLVRGALLRVRWTRPACLDGSWPLEVAPAAPKLLADFLTENVLANDAPRTLSAKAVFRERPAIFGPFPPGDVELLFRFGGREIGRRTVTVVPGETIDVEAPEVLPPPR